MANASNRGLGGGLSDLIRTMEDAAAREETRAVEVLIGMIASGKSTYARRRADDGALVVSHDALTEMLHGRYRYEAGLRSAYQLMEEEIARIALGAGRPVVIDRTHLTFESRQRWLTFALFERVPCIAVVFPNEGPEVHARRRFESDPRGRSLEEWTKVAEHHERQAITDHVLGLEKFREVRVMGGDGITESTRIKNPGRVTSQRAAAKPPSPSP